MSAREYILILRKYGWIIVVAIVLAALLAFTISSFQKKLHQAAVEVSTVPARADWGLGNTAKDLMRNFTANLKTPEVAARVIARQQLDMNPYDLLANTQIEPDSSTFTIKMQVRNADGEVAKLAALGFADEFLRGAHRLLRPARQERSASRSRFAAATSATARCSPSPCSTPWPAPCSVCCSAWPSSCC
jgi:capsular polysaccharide biosynthesis protein